MAQVTIGEVIRPSDSRMITKTRVVDGALESTVDITEYGFVFGRNSSNVGEVRYVRGTITAKLLIGDTTIKSNIVITQPPSEKVVRCVDDGFAGSVLSYPITKNGSPQSHPLYLRLTCSKLVVVDTNGTQTEVADSTATIDIGSVRINAWDKPTVTATAERDSSDPLTVHFNVDYNSVKAEDTSISLAINGTSIATLNNGANTVTGLSGDAFTCTITASDVTGTSAPFEIVVPQAFFTMDIGGEGKSIAFGGQAPDTGLPDNGRMDIFMDLFLDGNLVADHIIERGTELSWDYIKWASGKCEAWRRIEENGVFGPTGSFAGGIYYRTLSYRVPTFMTPLTIVSNGKWGTGLSWTCVRDIDLTIGGSFSITYFSNQSSANTAFASVYACGRWK